MNLKFNENNVLKEEKTTLITLKTCAKNNKAFKMLAYKSMIFYLDTKLASLYSIIFQNSLKFLGYFASEPLNDGFIFIDSQACRDLNGRCIAVTDGHRADCIGFNYRACAHEGSCLCCIGK